jgi:hypothetical protein
VEGIHNIRKNQARNSVKHLSDKDHFTFEADIKDEALWMLVRAIENYSRLELKLTDLMHEFDEWFYENINGS